MRSRVAAALLPGYVAHRSRDCAAIRAALEARDFDAIVRIGHNLRGNGPAFGFPELAVLGAALESAAGGEDVAEVRAHLAALERWLPGGPRHASETRMRAMGPDGAERDPHDEDT